VRTKHWSKFRKLAKVFEHNSRERIASNIDFLGSNINYTGVSRPISITICDKNETKLNMPLFKLSIVMTFVQGDPIQPFNPFGENRP
jgi:hypothetical protein